MTFTVRSTNLVFPGGSGQTLAATFEAPEAEPHAFALFAPCFTCSKDSKAIVRMSRELAERGIAVLRYDVTGIGESEGDFSETSFESQQEDLIAAAAFLRARHRAPALLLGISLGGAVAISTASRLPGVGAVAVVNAPASLDHLRMTLLRLAPELATVDSKEVVIVGQKVRIGRRFVDDLRKHSVMDAVAGLDVHVLVAAATDDEIVPPDHGERLFEAAGHPKSFLAIPGSDHLMLRDPDTANWLGRMVAAWFERV